MSRRMEKVNDLVQSELAELLQRRVKDPVLADAFISLTHVEVSPDLSVARIHVSVMGTDDESEEVMARLDRASPFLHRELMKRIRIKRVPRLRFILDHSIAEADRLTSLMRQVSRTEGQGE